MYITFHAHNESITYLSFQDNYQNIMILIVYKIKLEEEMRDREGGRRG